MQKRPMKRLAKELALAARSKSYRRVAKEFGIFTPKGKPNPGMVYRLIHGYQPKRLSTLSRIPVLPETTIVHAEPIRRSLSGPWRLGDRWVSPEEFFGKKP